MESSVLSEIVLPLAIVIIMVALGMTLTIADFRRVLTQARAVTVGLLCQLILLPLIGLAVAFFFPLEAIFAISIVLLAASPGGTTSNLIVHASELDRALSVTLTAISNLLSVFSIPLLLGLAFRIFADGSESIALPVGDIMLQVAALTFIPVIIGMGIRAWRPGFAERTKTASRIFSSVVLLLVIIALVIENWDEILAQGPRFALAFIALNLIALAVGFGVAKLFRLDQIRAATIGIETGVQNSTLAITIGLSVLDSPPIAVIPGLYGIWMLATGFAFAFWLNRGAATDEPAATAPP